MACMEWQCSSSRCSFRTMNNESRMGMCPKCGMKLQGFFDEQFDQAYAAVAAGDDQDDD